MKEILFRGKRKDTGEWVYGYGAIDNDILTLDFAVGIVRVPCVEGTVGQYTGLTDKYGVKIFEGDILDCGDRIVKVVWHEQAGLWDCDFIRYKGELCSNGITPVDWKYRAVVIDSVYNKGEKV